MATQRPVGKGQPQRQSSQQPNKQPNRQSSGQPGRESTEVRDLGAETMWHTRGLQTNTRMRMTTSRRVPQRQLPPSRLPRLLLWGVLLAIAGMLANAAFQMLR